MRCKWERENLARGQWRIVVSELPHGISVRQVMEEIEALANPKPGLGKKEVSQEQRRMKQFILDQVEGVRDESDRKSKLRLVITTIRRFRQNHVAEKISRCQNVKIIVLSIRLAVS